MIASIVVFLHGMKFARSPQYLWTSPLFAGALESAGFTALDVWNARYDLTSSTGAASGTCDFRVRGLVPKRLRG